MAHFKYDLTEYERMLFDEVKAESPRYPPANTYEKLGTLLGNAAYFTFDAAKILSTTGRTTTRLEIKACVIIHI